MMAKNKKNFMVGTAIALISAGTVLLAIASFVVTMITVPLLVTCGVLIMASLGTFVLTCTREHKNQSLLGDKRFCHKFSFLLFVACFIFISFGMIAVTNIRNQYNMFQAGGFTQPQQQNDYIYTSSTPVPAVLKISGMDAAPGNELAKINATVEIRLNDVLIGSRSFCEVSQTLYAQGTTHENIAQFTWEVPVGTLKAADNVSVYMRLHEGDSLNICVVCDNQLRTAEDLVGLLTLVWLVIIIAMFLAIFPRA